MKFRWQPEKSAKAWALRMCIGPAMVIDAVAHFFTLGCLSLGCSLEVSRKLAMVRFEQIKK